MTSLVSKLTMLERRLAGEEGVFILFGLFQLSDGSGNWDIVVSANWIDAKDLDSTRFFVKQIASALGEKDILKTRGIFTLSPSQPFVIEAVTRFPVNAEEKVLQLSNVEIAGLHMNSAYIITAVDIIEKTGFVGGQGEQYALKTTGERGEQDIPAAIRYLPLRVSAVTTDASDSTVIPSMP